MIRLAPVLLMDGVTALREAAVAGAGMTIQPDWLIASEIARGALVRVLPDWSIPPIPVHVVFPSGPLPKRLRMFVDYAAEAFPQIVDELTSSVASSNHS